MSFFQFTSLVLVLPIIRVLYKCWRKNELSMFDLLLLFTCFQFAILPLLNMAEVSYNIAISSTVFFILFVFEYGLLVVAFCWDKLYSSSNSIINITRYLKTIRSLTISKSGYVLIIFLLISVLVIYMPYAALSVRIDSASQVLAQDYVLKTTIAILASVMSLIMTILSIKVIFQFKKKRFKLVDIVFFVSSLIICAFFPRRFFLQNILFFFLIFYSVCRNKISIRYIFIFFISALFLFQVYFPFYDVIRSGSIHINSEEPIASLYEAVIYGLDHKSEFKRSKKSAQKRTIGLYDALYNLQKAEYELQYGELILSEIDVAIPKVLNPNKGIGSEKKLESMTGKYVDIADSILLEACGDFGLLGSVVAIFLYVLILGVYSLYRKILCLFGGYEILSIFILYELFSICWNVEGCLAGTLSWFFSSFVWIIVLFFCSKYRIIFVKRNSLMNLFFKNS